MQPGAVLIVNGLSATAPEVLVPGFVRWHDLRRFASWDVRRLFRRFALLSVESLSRPQQNSRSKFLHIKCGTRYRQALRSEISQTLSNSNDLEDELQRLLNSLG